MNFRFMLTAKPYLTAFVRMEFTARFSQLFSKVYLLVCFRGHARRYAYAGADEEDQSDDTLLGPVRV